MNILSFEAWYNIEYVSFVVFGSLAILGMISSIYFFINRRTIRFQDDPGDPYGTVPPWGIVGTLAILFIVISLGSYYKMTSERNIAGLTKELSDTQLHLRVVCHDDETLLGCPSMYKQYRADSMWVEQRLIDLKIKKPKE